MQNHLSKFPIRWMAIPLRRSSLKKLLWTMTLGISLIVAIATPALFAQEAARIGFTIEGNQTLNRASLTSVTYTGQCPGNLEPQLKAWFSSSTTPPQDGLRVFIQNVTPGVDPDDMPYTDRKYDEGTTSEYTVIEFGTEHSSRTFRVLNGENTFNYEIRNDDEDDEVVESGTFVATFNNRQRTEARDATCRTEQNVCANSAVSQNVCADLRTRTQCSCPNGNIVQTTLEPSGPVRTLISNQTDEGISYRMSGRLYHLDSGEDRWIEGNTPGSLSFDDGSGFSQTRSLTAGTRYQFTDSLSGSIQFSQWQR